MQLDFARCEYLAALHTLCVDQPSVTFQATQSDSSVPRSTRVYTARVQTLREYASAVGRDPDQIDTAHARVYLPRANA